MPMLCSLPFYTVHQAWSCCLLLLTMSLSSLVTPSCAPDIVYEYPRFLWPTCITLALAYIEYHSQSLCPVCQLIQTVLKCMAISDFITCPCFVSSANFLRTVTSCAVASTLFINTRKRIGAPAPSLVAYLIVLTPTLNCFPLTLSSGFCQPAMLGTMLALCPSRHVLPVAPYIFCEALYQRLWQNPGKSLWLNHHHQQQWSISPRIPGDSLCTIFLHEAMLAGLEQVVLQ